MLRLRQILLPILFLLFLAPSAYAQEDLLSRLDKATGVKLPDGYGEKVASFVKTNFVMQDKDALAFTEQFIVEKMKEDWGINRQNQLLFVWYAIHDKVVGEDLYDGEDGDDARLEDFETAIENVDACGTAFYDGFMEWMMARSDEYDKLFAEYQKQSAEYQKLSAEAKRSMITDNIATIEGYLQDIRYGLGDLKRMKDEGIITMKDTELCMEEFSKTEKDIFTQYNPLLKKVQGGLMDGDLDDCLSLSYQLVLATAELVSAISDRRSAEYQKQSAEYQKQSAEYQKQYAKATQELIRALKDDVYAIVSFYDTYLIDPDKESVETRERVRSFKAKVQDVYEIAKKENFDFKDELLKAVGGDENKAKDIFKWLGIE